MASKWQTESLFTADMIGAMVNVRLPTENATVAGSIPSRLQEEYNTWVPVYPLQGKWYTRVSAQVYNELSDFEMLADAIIAIVKS